MINLEYLTSLELQVGSTRCDFIRLVQAPYAISCADIMSATTDHPTRPLAAWRQHRRSSDSSKSGTSATAAAAKYAPDKPPSLAAQQPRGSPRSPADIATGRKETLRTLFKGIATNGVIAANQVGAVLAGAEMGFHVEEIEHAVQQVLGDTCKRNPKVSYDQVMEMYHLLVAPPGHHHAEIDMPCEPPLTNVRHGVVAALRQRLTRCAAAIRSASGQSLKPTHRLLMVNTGFALITLAVATFAAAFLSADVTSSYQASLTQTRHGTGIVKGMGWAQA